MDKNKWLATHPYEFERDKDGNLFILIDEGEYIIKQQLPDNSPTKFLLKQLQYNKLIREQASKDVMKVINEMIEESNKEMDKNRPYSIKDLPLNKKEEWHIILTKSRLLNEVKQRLEGQKVTAKPLQ